MPGGRPTDRIFIYGLCCPDTGRVMYIGKAENVENRFKQHLYPTKAKKSRVASWIRDLRVEGKKPKVQTLLCVEKEGWEKHEIETIKYYKSMGLAELNVAKGGQSCDRTFMNEKEKAFYERVREIGVNLHCSKRNGRIDQYKRLLINCIVFCEILKERSPKPWLKLRWDVDELGDLTQEVVKKYISHKLYNKYNILVV